MKNYLIHILVLIFTSTTISYGQTSINQTNVEIDDNEFGLILTKKKRYVLKSGKHLLDKESLLIKFNKVDSLQIMEFDILDLNAQSLFCQIQVKYSLSSKQIKNIADLLEWKHSIKSYKKLLIAQKIKSEIRRVTENYKAIDLKKNDYKNKYQIDKYIGDRLSKYIDLISLELEVYEK